MAGEQLTYIGEQAAEMIAFGVKQAIEAASESGGGLRIVPINQEAYAELPQDQQDRDDIIWDVYDEDYEVTSKDIFFDWSDTTLTEDNIEDVIKQVNDKTDENTNVISTLNSTMETKAGFPDFGHVGNFASGFTFEYNGYALFRGRCEVTKTLLYRVYINDVLVLTRSQVPYSNDEFMASGLIPIKKGQRVTFEVGCVGGTLWQFDAYRIPCAN